MPKLGLNHVFLFISHFYAIFYLVLGIFGAVAFNKLPKQQYLRSLAQFLIYILFCYFFFNEHICFCLLAVTSTQPLKHSLYWCVFLFFLGFFLVESSFIGKQALMFFMSVSDLNVYSTFV